MWEALRPAVSSALDCPARPIKKEELVMSTLKSLEYRKEADKGSGQIFSTVEFSFDGSVEFKRANCDVQK